eukprot:TRINITY_DN10290_c0_g1_i1.p1 TRINITY_DN10290_c0_g1~~TRINITY_DN10290_c0_g1_i1.p1  ORF type:complete len:359 (-),score=108.58 TRINITY_DN10290_c0_g1_i1:157-1233(-)
MVLKLGGEGVMLRAPRSKYEFKRSDVLLKVKNFFDEDARVIGYRPGKGNLAGMMGAIECELPNGVKFHIGSGFTNAQRKNNTKPKIGQIVSFKYQELSEEGNPRFPVFLRVRVDITWDDVVRDYKLNPPFSSVKKITPKLKKEHSLIFSVVPSRDGEGKKIVADDDVCSDVDDEVVDPSKQNNPQQKLVCKYGKLCYRKNLQHLNMYSHDESNPVAAEQVLINTDDEPTLPLDSPLMAHLSDELSCLEDMNSRDGDKMDGGLPNNNRDDEASYERLQQASDCSSHDGDGGGDEEAMARISVREWHFMLNKIHELEKKIMKLQETTAGFERFPMNNTKFATKREREDDDYGGIAKKTKL